MRLSVKVIFTSHVMFMNFTVFLRSPLCFLMKHRTSKMYIEVTVRILLSLNFCLQDSSLFSPVINLINFF